MELPDLFCFLFSTFSLHHLALTQEVEKEQEAGGLTAILATRLSSISVIYHFRLWMNLRFVTVTIPPVHHKLATNSSAAARTTLCEVSAL